MDTPVFPSFRPNPTPCENSALLSRWQRLDGTSLAWRIRIGNGNRTGGYDSDTDAGTELNLVG